MFCDKCFSQMHVCKLFLSQFSGEIAEDKENVDVTDTPAKQSLITKDDEDVPHDTSASDNSHDKGKGINKKGQDKSSFHSKSNRPHHLKIPKALQRTFSAQSNGNQQSKCEYVAVYQIVLLYNTPKFVVEVKLSDYQVNLILKICQITMELRFHQIYFFIF